MERFSRVEYIFVSDVTKFKINFIYIFVNYSVLNTNKNKNNIYVITSCDYMHYLIHFNFTYFRKFLCIK